MRKVEAQMYLAYLFILLMILLMVSLTGCTNGWSVGDMETYAYVEILDQDSTSHFYADKININSDNWCFIHSRFETIREP